MPLDPDHEAKTAIAHKIATEVARMRGEIATLKATQDELVKALDEIESIDFDGYSLSELHELVIDIARAALAKARQP